MNDAAVMMSPEEAAGLLSLHPETVRTALRDGRLQGAKLGGVWRVSRADLDAWWRKCGGGSMFGPGGQGRGTTAHMGGMTMDHRGGPGSGTI